MHDAWPFAVVLALSALTYAMRVVGYLMAGTMGISDRADRLLRLAPGNFFVAVAAVAAAEGGLSVAAGSMGTMLAMRITGREWIALASGALAAAVTVYA